MIVEGHEPGLGKRRKALGHQLRLNLKSIPNYNSVGLKEERGEASDLSSIFVPFSQTSSSVLAGSLHLCAALPVTSDKPPRSSSQRNSQDSLGVETSFACKWAP